MSIDAPVLQIAAVEEPVGVDLQGGFGLPIVHGVRAELAPQLHSMPLKYSQVE